VRQSIALILRSVFLPAARFRTAPARLHKPQNLSHQADPHRRSCPPWRRHRTCCRPSARLDSHWEAVGRGRQQTVRRRQYRAELVRQGRAGLFTLLPPRRRPLTISPSIYAKLVMTRSMTWLPSPWWRFHHPHPWSFIVEPANSVKNSSLAQGQSGQDQFAAAGNGTGSSAGEQFNNDRHRKWCMWPDKGVAQALTGLVGGEST